MSSGELLHHLPEGLKEGYVMEVYSCGQCGGPLEVSVNESVVICQYCGFANNIANLETELARFKKEMSSWLSRLGVVGQTGIDTGMRLLYFKDEIYPDLATEFTNLMGNEDISLDFPLVYLKIYSQLPDLSPRFRWTAASGKPLKDFARRLESPELQSFAVNAETKKMLLELKLDALMIPMLMDVINLSLDPEPENFIRCANTLSLLAKEVHAIVEAIQGDDTFNDYSAFYSIFENRLNIASTTYRLLAEKIDNHENIDKLWLNDTVRELIEMRAQLKGLGGVSIIHRVPMEAGLANDAESLLTWREIMRSYVSITKGTFNEYINALNQLAIRTFFFKKQALNNIDISWFTDNIDTKKFTWFIGEVSSAINRREVRIIPPDKGPRNAPFLYPFYLIYVRTILKTGVLWWKRGEVEDFYALCDAGFNLYSGFYGGDFPSLLTPSGKKVVGKNLEKTLEALKYIEPEPAPLDSIVIPPIISPQDAEMIFIQAHNFREEAELAKAEGSRIEIPSSYKRKGFDPGRVKAVDPEVKGLYYVPMAIVKNVPTVYGKKYEIETKLDHRLMLANAFVEFLKKIA